MGLFATPKVQGDPPAIGALNVQQSCYGTPITLVYGTNRSTGNLLLYTAFQSVQVATGGGAGGKGGVVGGGGKGGGSSTWNYYASFQIGISEGPINGIGEVWVSKQITNMADLGGNTFVGSLDQAPWGYLSSTYPTFAIGYNKLSYAAFENFSLGTSSETPQFSFEVQGLLYGANGGQDAYADQFFIDFLKRCGFPAGNIDALTDIANYWLAMGYFISPIIDQQQPASEWMKNIAKTLNADFVNSGGLISMKPYADSVITGNGVTYTPDLVPWYDLGDDDFVIEGDEEPVHVIIPDMADAYNQIPIEYCNRANQYNIETYTAEDAAHIDMYGIRTGSTIQAHHITDPNMAQLMANIYLWRQIYVEHGPTFVFKLPWNYFLLDPMDLITISDSKLGLVRKLVRVQKIDEDEKTGVLTFTCEDMPGSVAAPAVYASQTTNRNTPNYNLDPGMINPPYFFEAPLALVQSSDVEVDIAVSGANPIWGGCNVYVSNDGDTYKYFTQINGGSRMGKLTAPLATFAPQVPGNNIDATNTLAISMAISNGLFNNAATQTDATNFNTLCYVDGELISFGNDVLTAANSYNLTYLNRGCYQSTIGAHASGSNFARLDESIVRYPVDQSRVGQTLYFKFQSFNVWGGGQEDISTVTPYTYSILGTALLTPLANPTGLSVSYVDNIARLSWTGINDIRYPILYQIRKGATFANAQIIGTTATTNFLVYGSDTYWVTALYYTPFNVAVLSATPVSIAVTTPALPQYIIETHEEDPTWSGTVSGSAIVVGSVIELQGLNILAQSSILDLLNIFAFSGAAASGGYTIPVGNRITTADICNAKVIMNWTLTAVSASSDVTAMSDIPTTPDITGEVSSTLVAATPQIRVSQDGGSTWGAWQNWVPGVYPGNAWDFQIFIATLDPTVNAILSTFGYTVDVPLATQAGTATTSASITTNVSFTNAYNIVPYIAPTILNQQTGDYYVLGTVTTTGFPIDVYNGASRVVRNISYTATGY